jgi:hypothetical protein
MMAWRIFRVVFPYTEGYTATDQRVKLLLFCKTPRSVQEMMAYLDFKHRKSFRDVWLKPLVEAGLLSMTLPDKPSSPKQKYQTTQATQGQGHD